MTSSTSGVPMVVGVSGDGSVPHVQPSGAGIAIVRGVESVGIVAQVRAIGDGFAVSAEGTKETPRER